MDDKVIVRFQIVRKKVLVDIEIPLDITAEELIASLNEAYSLGIPKRDIPISYLVCEQPVILVKGDETLRQLGIRDGSILRYTG